MNFRLEIAGENGFGKTGQIVHTANEDIIPLMVSYRGLSDEHKLIDQRIDDYFNGIV